MDVSLFSTEVRARHECKTSMIGKANKNLTNAQKSIIERTPFKWLMFLPEKLNISCILLRELVERWDEKRGGFRIQNKLVPFKPLDVCLSLGIRITGKKVKLDEVLELKIKKYFEGQRVNAKVIFNQLAKLDKDEDAEEFAKIYILLGISEFYFPNSYREGHCYLYDLDSLGQYNWGLAIYDYLVDSLNRATRYLEALEYHSQIHINGCTVLLQIWACEHLSLYRRRRTNVSHNFPRILKWHDAVIFDKYIVDSIENNLVIEELSVTRIELLDGVGREALFMEASHGKFNFKQISHIVKDLDRENQLLLVDNCEMQAMILQLEQQLRELKQSSCKSPEVKYSCIMVDSVREDVVAPTLSKDDEALNLYTRLKDNPRTRMAAAWKQICI